MDDPWHFPRRPLAWRYAEAITLGPLRRLLLRGPPGAGKTQFLLRDLAPLVVRRGHKVVYASLRDAPQAPQLALIRALEKAEKRGGSRRLLDEALQAAVIRSPFTFAPERRLPQRLPAPTSEELRRLGGLLRGQARRSIKRPLLLVIDDVQQLAAQREFASLTASLRTVLDVLGAGILVIYAGSSPEAIAKIFWRRNAPFFVAAHEEMLPDLDGAYIQHVASVFQQATGRRLDRGEAAKVFEALGRNPRYMMLWVTYRLLYPRISGSEARRLAQARLAIENGYEEIKAGLDMLDYAILRAVIDKRALFAKVTAKRIADGAGIPAPPEKVQARISSLMRKGVLMTGEWRGQYEFQDGAFRDWLFAKTRRRRQ